MLFVLYFILLVVGAFLNRDVMILMGFFGMNFELLSAKIDIVERLKKVQDALAKNKKNSL